MKAKIGLLVISVLTAAFSISPFGFAQEGPYGRTPVSTASASTKGNSAEAAREDATSKVKEGNDYRKARAELKDSIVTAKAKAALGKDEQTRHSAIQIATANGIVVLSGRVDSKAGADRAQAIVARLKGVKDVHNELMYPASGYERITHTEHESPMTTVPVSGKDNSGAGAEAARESTADATSEVKEGNDYRKARAELKDSILTAKAKAALGKDKQTRHSAIQIATANGIVVLSGRVNSKAAADRAQEIAARPKGVKHVHNELMYPASGNESITHTEHESPMTTVPVSTKEQGNSGAEAARESTADATSKVKEGNDYRKARAELKDSILTAKAKAALGKDEQTRNSAIQIATANGIVVLNGRVDSKAGADRAQAIVAGLKGVKDVRNELTYRASSDDKATLPNANRQ